MKYQIMNARSWLHQVSCGVQSSDGKVVLILSNAKSADGGNNSIFGFSINIHVIQNPNESSM